MKPTPIATPVKALEAIAPATNLKPITSIIVVKGLIIGAGKAIDLSKAGTKVDAGVGSI